MTKCQHAESKMGRGRQVDPFPGLKKLFEKIDSILGVVLEHILDLLDVAHLRVVDLPDLLPGLCDGPKPVGRVLVLHLPRIPWEALDPLPDGCDAGATPLPVVEPWRAEKRDVHQPMPTGDP